MTGRVCQGTYDPLLHAPVYQDCNATNDSCGALFTVFELWTPYTPQVDQGVTTNIAKTVLYSKYTMLGKTCTWVFNLAITAGGTAGSAVTVSTPFPGANQDGMVGAGGVYDASIPQRHVAAVQANSTTKVLFMVDNVVGAAAWGVTPNLAIANGDYLAGAITYETV